MPFLLKDKHGYVSLSKEETGDKKTVCKDGSLLPMYFTFDEILALAEVIKEIEEEKMKGKEKL